MIPLQTAGRAPDHTLLERGWLSANNILLHGSQEEGDVLIDSGHCTHAPQTVALVEQALERPGGSGRLTRLVNTHLHSDHCGGNATLQARWRVHTAIPPGQAEAVRAWDEDALSYRPTGQRCERFVVDATVQPGEVLRCGNQAWEALAAPGHDPHSLIFFNAATGVLISADALWENGFGVVFPELEGLGAFDEVADTLELIARLPVRSVIPGHGPAFDDVGAALERARSRLAGFRADPRKHARYGAKVLVKYHLMEVRSQGRDALQRWVEGTPLMHATYQRAKSGRSNGVDLSAEPTTKVCGERAYAEWCSGVVDELLNQGALRCDTEGVVHDA